MKKGFLSRVKNTVINTWALLSTTIYVDERLEKSLKADAITGHVICVISIIMTIMNIIQKKGFVTYSTAAIFIGGMVIVISIKKYRNRRVAILSLMFVCTLSFSYYAILGVNEGFAILWTLLVPLSFCYFVSVKYGIIISMYFEILFIVLFYTPIRAYESGFYSKTFMNRYPVLYLCGLLMTSVAMIQYHISTLRQMDYEKQLQAAVRRAESADRAKSMFLAQMSHEIRTPINGVLGMNEMILREADDPDIKEYAVNIRSAGNTLLSLINSILDFSKIEDGKMELVPANYDTASFIRNLDFSIASRAKSKGLLFYMDIDEKLPTTLFGDDMRLSQVVMNLLTNAVKYTEEGSVTLTIKRMEDINDYATVFFSVKDTGIGIKEEDKPRLFVSFERLDETKNRHIEGTGLGMSIVTSLLEMMDSHLDVESTYNVGSEFSFSIKQKIVDPKPIGAYTEELSETSVTATDQPVIKAPNAHVLVVDDNDMNLKVAKGLLKFYGISPDLSSSGTDAIEHIKKHTYDIVFLDHMMPKMNGLEVLDILKKENLLPEATTVIALTANAVIGSREMYLSAGFDDYLSKPIDIKELEKKLKAFLPESAFEAPVDKDLVKRGERLPAGSDNILEFFPENDGITYHSDIDYAKINPDILNTKTGLRYAGNDISLYKEILSAYADGFEERSAFLADQFDCENWDDYAVTVHALKSNSKSIGDSVVSGQALSLEEAAKAGDTEFIKQHHKELMRSYRELTDAIKEVTI